MALQFDYYKVLELDRSSEEDNIKRAYKKLALKYHPERNSAPDSLEQFTKVAEAYHVLSHPKRKAIYDQYGVDGLKKGVPSKSEFEGFEGGYEFHGNADEIFQQFFGGKNPFTDFFAAHIESDKAVFGSKFGGLHGMNKAVSGNKVTQDPPIEVDLNLQLEELYTGCLKKIKISRKVLHDDGITTEPREKILTIEVARGWKAGTKVIFTNEGDQGPNRIPADIVFIVKEQKHPVFTRSGNDLIYTADIPLVKALVGTCLDITTLDSRLLKIPLNETVGPDYVKRVPNEGMPISKNPEKRGDLLIKFKTSYPKILTEQQKNLLKEALGSS